VILSGGGQKSIEHWERPKGHEFTPRSRLGGTNRQQSARAPKIALKPVAPDTKMVSLC
jgi:hypothetical protein